MGCKSESLVNITIKIDVCLAVFYPGLVEFPKPTETFIKAFFFQNDDYFDTMKWNSLLLLVEGGNKQSIGN